MVPNPTNDNGLLNVRIHRLETERDSILQIGKSLSSELNLDRLLVLVIDEVNRLMNSERGTFFIVDEERGELWSRVAQNAEVEEIRLKIGKGIAGYVAKTGETINIEDAYNDSRFDSTTDKKTGYKTRSMLCMPILESTKNEFSKKKIIGVLQILNKREGIFNKDDEALLASIASQIAISVNNSYLFTRLEKKMNEQELLFAIERESNKARTLDDLLALLITEITKTLNVEAALITLRDKNTDKFVHRASHNINLENYNGNKEELERGEISKMESTGEIYHSNSAENDPLFNKAYGDLLGIKVSQFAYAPLKVGNEVIGFLEVFNKAETNDFFRNEDILLIESLASQISRISNT